MKTGASGASSKSLPTSRSSPRGAGKTKERIKCRSTVTCLLLSALPILAQQAAVDPYEDLPDYYPQHYRSLADVPEQYHDGEKLTGCFIHDHVLSDNIGPLLGPERIECHNPFYLDEHGRIKRFHYTSDPARKPPSGLPLGSEQRESQPTPCEGCLSEEQVLDVVRVYHRELGIEPLGYKASIVRGYPWNGHGNSTCKKYDPNYLDSLHPDPRDPHPHQRVNMRRVRRPMMGFNELCERFKDPQNRDFTWRVSFQIGWHEPENRILNELNQHKRHWPRTPCTVTNYIHARTGKIRNKYHYRLQRYNDNLGERCRGATIANVNLLASSARQAWNAYFQMHQRLFRYLPDSPSRDDRWLDYSEAKGYIESAERRLERRAKRKREAEEREREARGVRKIILPPNNLRGAGSAGAGVVPFSDTSDNGSQHILVYWGESPTIDLDYDNCYQKDDPDTPDVDESELHESKCKARVPPIRQCDASNVPLANPDSVEEENKHDCILWSRLGRREDCWYRNEKGKRERGWCARKSENGTSYRGKGFTSTAIQHHIAAVETLTAHQVGMHCDDPDFEAQCDRLENLFNTSFSNNGAFAEINLFAPGDWNTVRPGGNGFYLHRYGTSKYDDPFTKSKKNDQYRRINAPFDWYTRDAWCANERRRCSSDRIRYRYTLTHEGAHDVTSSHLNDRFSWLNVPGVNRAFYQTEGVLEGHALFIEEIAGRRRDQGEFKLDRPHPSGSGSYELPTPNVGNRKEADALATKDNYLATAEALLTAFRGVEDALQTAAGTGLVALPLGVLAGTRKLFNNSLHSYTALHELFGRRNAHIDFCEVRNEVQRRVWLLRKVVDSATLFSVPQPNIARAFDAMDIPTCMQPWDASSTKECAAETGGNPACRKVYCEFNPGDIVPVMIPPSMLPPGGDVSSCSIRVGDDVEIVRNNGVYQICVTVTWVINDVPFEIRICWDIAL